MSSPGLLGHDLLVQPPKRRILRARRDAEVILDDHTVVEVRRLERGLLGQGQVVHPARLLELEGAPELNKKPARHARQISQGLGSLKVASEARVRTRDS